MLDCIRFKTEGRSVLDIAENYPNQSCRSFDSYWHHLYIPEGFTRDLLCDLPTSGGLLVSVEQSSVDDATAILREFSVPINIIGHIMAHKEGDAIIALK
jgi:selenophosphate synthase